MKIYVDYAFYASEYGSKIPYDYFERYAKEASTYIRYLTIRKSDDYNGEELKYATCAVAEAYYNHDKTCVNGRAIQSENNDGYSVTFANDSQDTETIKRNAAYSAAKKWLSGTGLLRRGAKRVNKC